MRILPCLLMQVACLALLNSASAQKLLLKQSIYFKSGSYRLRSSEIPALDSIVSLSHGAITIRIEGNADSIGSVERNNTLSASRAVGARLLLVVNGIPGDIITTDALGSTKPIATNKTREGRRLNRRVDIFVFENETINQEALIVPDINELYKQLGTPLQTFCINPLRDTSIRCKQGTIIHIKANTVVPSANCNGQCVTFRVREDLLQSDMILDNLSTTSNGEMLESQGMVYTEAVDCNGNKLSIQKNKDLVILVPTDAINPRSGIFDGKRMDDNIMNWLPDSASLLSSFSLGQLDQCGRWICSVVTTTVNCTKCHFFFCKIGRVGKSLKGIFSEDQRMKNEDFRTCQSNLSLLKKPSTTVVSTNPTVIVTKPPIDSSLIPRCNNLEALFKKYGVNSLEGLLLAINKPLLDSFRVTTLQQLEDTLRKVNRQNVEIAYLNRRLSYDEFKYYIYNTTSFGWKNVDCFASIPSSEKTILKVNLKGLANVDCKLFFRGRRVVMPGVKTADYIYFDGVPKGESAIIVAIKYQDNKPYLGMKQVLISNQIFDIEFTQLTLEELKQQLKKLD